MRQTHALKSCAEENKAFCREEMNRRYVIDLEDEDPALSHGKDLIGQNGTSFDESSWHKSVERLLEVFIIVTVSLLIAFLLTIIYYDSLSINRINSIMVFQSFFSPAICHKIIHISEMYAKEHSWTTNRHRNYPTTDIPAFYLNDYNITIIKEENGAKEEVSYPFVKWLNETIEKQIFPLMSDSFQIPTEEVIYDEEAHPLDSEVREAEEEEGRNRRIRREHHNHLTGRKKDVKSNNLYELYCKDLFIVKYDAEHELSQRHLALHMDSSTLTFSLSLSPFSDLTAPIIADPSNITTKDDSDLTEIQNHSYQDGGTRFYLSPRVVINPLGSLMLHNSALFHEGIKISKGKRYIMVGFVNIRKKEKKTEQVSENDVATTLENKEKEQSTSIFDYITKPFTNYYDYYHSIFFTRKFGAYSHCMELLSYSPSQHELATESNEHFQIPHQTFRIHDYHMIGKSFYC